jgi:hypothetical protein
MSAKNCAHELLKSKLTASFQILRYQSYGDADGRQRNRRRQIKVDRAKNPKVSSKYQAPAVSNILFKGLRYQRISLHTKQKCAKA